MYKIRYSRYFKIYFYTFKAPNGKGLSVAYWDPPLNGDAETTGLEMQDH